MVPWAIIPSAGEGTRLRPATAVVPKVLLPVGTRPMLHWATREALDAGARALIVVVSPQQPLVRAYLRAAASAARGDGPLGELGALLAGVELHFIEQPRPAGIGDALVRCRGLTGEDPFAVVLPDNWFDGPEPAISQVARTFEDLGINAIGLVEVAPDRASLYGNVGGVELEELGGPAHRILTLQDKGAGSFRIDGRRAVLRGCARYVLDSSFYDALTDTGPPEQGEWDDVPAFQRLIATTGLAGHQLQGRHFDVGHRAGYLAAAAYLYAKAAQEA